MYLNKTVAIARLTPQGDDADKEAYVQVPGLANVKMGVAPATAELTAISNGVYGQTFQGYTTISGLKIGDQVTISGSNDKFIIKGINDYFYGPIPHLEIVLFKGDN